MTYLLIRFFELYRKLGRRDLIKEINSLMTSWKKTTVEWKSKHQLQCTKKRSMNSYRDFRILQISRNKLMMISKVPWTVTCTQSKWRSSWKWIRKHRNKCRALPSLTSERNEESDFFHWYKKSPTPKGSELSASL